MKTNDQPGQFSGPAEVRFVRILPGPIERVWEYLTDAEKRSRWFAGGPLEQRKGGKVALHFRHKDIAPNETPPADYEQHHDPGHDMQGTVTRCEPPNVLAFTFGSDGESEVTFELTPRDHEVMLVVTHRATGGDVPYMSEFGAGWHTHLAHLVALLEGKPRPPFWPMFMPAKADYENLRLAAQRS